MYKRSATSYLHIVARGPPNATPYAKKPGPGARHEAVGVPGLL